MTDAPNIHEAKLQLMRYYVVEQLQGARDELQFATMNAFSDDHATGEGVIKAAIFLEEATKALGEIFKRKAAEVGDGPPG